MSTLLHQTSVSQFETTNNHWHIPVVVRVYIWLEVIAEVISMACFIRIKPAHRICSLSLRIGNAVYGIFLLTLSDRSSNPLSRGKSDQERINEWKSFTECGPRSLASGVVLYNGRWSNEQSDSTIATMRELYFTMENLQPMISQHLSATARKYLLTWDTTNLCKLIDVFNDVREKRSHWTLYSFRSMGMENGQGSMETVTYNNRNSCFAQNLEMQLPSFLFWKMNFYLEDILKSEPSTRYASARLS